MRINTLPEWANLIISSGPYFGSEENAGATGATGANGATGGTGAAIETPEADPADNAENKTVDNEEAVKAIRERDQLKAERDALAQEKQEREEAEAAAKAATRSKEENLEAQVETLTKDNEALKSVNEFNILKISILENQKYQWIDPSDVIKLIDKSNVKIDAKTGMAEGVEDALKSLAKAKPHLLKPKADDQGNSGNGTSATPSAPPLSGGTPGGNRDSSAEASKRKKMVERFGNVLTP